MLTLSANTSTAISLFKTAEYDNEPIIFPTDTIYGIGAPVASVDANLKIFAIKNRPLDKPMPILIANMEQLASLVQPINGSVLQQLENLWPGKHTIIFNTVYDLNPIYTSSGTVAVRMLPPGWLAEAVAMTGPITATSVNFSGQPALTNPDDIYRAFQDTCRYMLWGQSGSTASVIIDISGKVPIVRRT